MADTIHYTKVETDAKINKVKEIATIGISGVLETTTVVPSTGKFKYEVFTPGNYTNVTPNIEVTPTEVEKKWVYIYVIDGVAQKEVKNIPDNSAEKNFNPSDDIHPSTMNATYRASDILFDAAITKKSGFEPPVSFGFGLIGNDTNNYNVIRINDIPITVNGKITKITQFSTNENITDIKFCVVRPTQPGGTIFKTIKVFNVTGFTPSNVSSIDILENIDVKIGDRIGFFTDNKLFNLNTSTGNSLSLPSTSIVEGAEAGVASYPGISWPYEFEVSSPKLTGDDAIDILEKINKNGVATMKQVHDSSEELFDEAITKKAGYTDPIVFGYGTDSTETSNYSVVRVNDIPITTPGFITKVSQNSSGNNTSNVQFCVLRQLQPGGTVFKTIKIFSVSGFSADTVSSVAITETIEVKAGDRLGVFIDGRSFKLNSTVGNSLNFAPSAMVEGAETGANINPGLSWCYTFEVRQAKLTGDDAVSILEKLNTTNINSKTYYLEDYGAQVLDPFNIDLSIDCTTAFQNCINEIFSDTKVVNAKIALRGMYRLGGAVKTWPNGNRSQIMFPTIDFEPNMVIKNVSIIGEYQPVWEEQAIARMPVSYAGSGFYSSVYNQGTSTYNWCISLGSGRDSSVFGEFNNINIYMDNITIMLRSHDENKQPVINTMSGIDASTNANFQFGRILVRTSVPAIDALQPSEKSMGLYLPKWNNHASLDGTYLRCNGFGTGLYATEHLELGKYIGLGNINGIHCEKFYPINIGQLILEMNKNPIVMGNGAYLNADVYQTERINDTSKWWYSTKDIVQESGTSSVTINRYVVHQEGGQMGVGSWDTGVKVKVINDEHNLSYNPLNMWQDLPTNPVNGLEGYHQGIRKIYLDGAWKNAITGNPV